MLAQGACQKGPEPFPLEQIEFSQKYTPFFTKDFLLGGSQEGAFHGYGFQFPWGTTLKPFQLAAGLTCHQTKVPQTLRFKKGVGTRPG